MMFKNTYDGKKVLITGHTGFKGSWLVSWLLQMGAEIVGVSKDIPTKPSLFKCLNLENRIKHYCLNIQDHFALSKVILAEKPDFIFHLAAQAIVSSSYEEPLGTIASNVLGTANVLEALRISEHPCIAVLITSDKAYDNIEQIWGYKENDSLGGKDIYSGSKGAAELIIKSYFESFFKSSDCLVRIGIARAGNVIGGGDWAKDRLVVDAMLAWRDRKKVQVRSPNSTRPWQHVLEPLSGYLQLGCELVNNPSLNGESFNFGPKADQDRTVLQLLDACKGYWDLSAEEAYEVKKSGNFNEAVMLRLNCDKALSILNWQANLDFEETVRFTSEWYYCFYHGGNIQEKTSLQLDKYKELGRSRNLSWMA